MLSPTPDVITELCNNLGWEIQNDDFSRLTHLYRNRLFLLNQSNNTQFNNIHIIVKMHLLSHWFPIIFGKLHSHFNITSLHVWNEASTLNIFYENRQIKTHHKGHSNLNKYFLTKVRNFWWVWMFLSDICICLKSCGCSFATTPSSTEDNGIFCDIRCRFNFDPIVA